MREGLFNEDELDKLENGYSVSDTGDEGAGIFSGLGEADILSFKSGTSHIGLGQDARLFAGA
jgi:hypothetical protein